MTHTPMTQARNDLLDWENLSEVPAGRALRRSLAELLVRPGRFFGKMAISGGLFEPLAFFAVVLGAAILLAFPAALAYVRLAAPDPERVGAAAYSAALLPARAGGLLLVLLPLALAAACVAMVLTGTLFHVGARLFAAPRWEGSVSVWLYAGGAALAPLTAGLAVLFAVSLTGCLLGLAWPEAQPAAHRVAAWTARVLLTAGLVAGVLLLAMDAVVGCMRALRAEPVTGAAAAVAGLVTVALTLGVTVWAFAGVGAAVGAGVGALVLCATTAVAVPAAHAGDRAEEDD